MAISYKKASKIQNVETDERRTTGVIVALGVALLILLFIIFGSGIFRGNNSQAPASSGPAPAGTNPTLPLQPSAP